MQFTRIILIHSANLRNGVWSIIYFKEINIEMEFFTQIGKFLGRNRQEEYRASTIFTQNGYTDHQEFQNGVVVKREITNAPKPAPVPRGADHRSFISRILFPSSPNQENKGSPNQEKNSPGK